LHDGTKAAEQSNQATRIFSSGVSVLSQTPATDKRHGSITKAHGGALMDAIVAEKRCMRCGKIKPLSEFYVDKKLKDGKTTRCKECLKQASKEWAHAHPEKVREIKKREHQKNKERYDAWNRENGNAYAHRDRIKKYGSTAIFERVNPKKITEKFGFRCSYPGCESKDLTVDHVVSLKNKGDHTLDNLQPLCKHHNIKKNAKNVDYRPGLNFLRNPDRTNLNGC